MQKIFHFLKKYQFFWDLAGKYSRFYPNYFFKQVPTNIIIETTNICNLRCPACPTNNGMFRNKGTMNYDLFRSIIDEFKTTPVKPTISMNFAGEPTLHPQLADFVEYASINGHKTFISTNTTILTPELSRKLIQAKLASIHLCLDGMTKKSHESYRVGSNFEKVIENIENFIKIKTELQSAYPKVLIQSLLTSFSENEKDELIEWAREVGVDGINLKTLNVNFGGGQSRDNTYLLPSKKENLRKTTNLKKTLCSFPINHAVVFWDGSLGLCCMDYNGVVKMGNVQNGGFLTNYHKAMKLRKLGFAKQYSICKNCHLSESDTVSTVIEFKK